MVIHLNPRELVQLVASTARALRRPSGDRLLGLGTGGGAPRLVGGLPLCRRGLDPVQLRRRGGANTSPERHAGAGVPASGVAAAPGSSDRARFGLPDGFVVLTSFDMRSGFVRKNPLAALAAVRRASELSGVAATLVCKVVGREGAPALYAELEAEARPAAT